MVRQVEGLRVVVLLQILRLHLILLEEGVSLLVLVGRSLLVRLHRQRMLQLLYRLRVEQLLFLAVRDDLES